jgi:hypothetical protein
MTKKEKVENIFISSLLALAGWVGIFVILLSANIFTSGLFPWDPALELFLHFLLIITFFIMAVAGTIITMMNISPIHSPDVYAHPELMKTNAEHFKFFIGIGSERIGWINGIIIKRFQKLVEKEKGKELSNQYLEQADLPNKINIYKKYPLDDYILYIQILKKNLNMNQIELHDSIVTNYYSSNRLGRMILGKMVKNMNKKRIVDVIIMAYRTISNKGQLIMIKDHDQNYR